MRRACRWPSSCVNSGSVRAALRHVANQPLLAEHAGSGPHRRKRQARPVRNVEQSMLTVGQIEDPEQSKPLGMREQPARPQSRFAFWKQVVELSILLQDVYGLHDNLAGFAKRLRGYAPQIVGRSVVLRILTVRSSAEPADRKIESG